MLSLHAQLQSAVCAASSRANLTLAPRTCPHRRSRSRSRSRSRGGSRGRGGGGGDGQRHKGEACRWNPRGFGFIKPFDGGEDIFCHVSVITDGNMLREGDSVEYEVVYDDRKGKYRADKVTGGRREEESRGGGGSYGGRDRYDDRRGGCKCIRPLSP